MKTTDTVIIDNGHGCDTPGKCSPDGSHLEWEWCRRCASAIADRLREHGIAAHILVPEETDVPLRVRLRRANELARRHPGAVLLSIHNNAAGADGQWHGASGWSAFVAPKASAESCRLARLLHAEAEARGLSGNRQTPSEGFWRGNFAICRDTVCPAVLTENMFQDCRGDVAVLSSSAGFGDLVELHVAAVLKYFKE